MSEGAIENREYGEVVATEEAGAAEWLFGYGSLVWKPEEGLEEAEVAVGRVDGMVRRLHQGSTDHRGTFAAPGRVATLEARREGDEGCVWGVAYRLPDGRHKDEMRARLDHREKDGYALVDVVVHTRDGRSLAAATYLATPANPSYLGPAPIEAIAGTVATAVGPSGPNADYVLHLDDALATLDVPHDHVAAVAAAVRARLAPDA